VNVTVSVVVGDTGSQLKSAPLTVPVNVTVSVVVGDTGSQLKSAPLTGTQPTVTTNVSTPTPQLFVTVKVAV
jgi:hypothetical protein